MRTYTALIVDDEELARNSIRLLLKKRLNWNIVGEAVDGKEAMELIDIQKPNLVFLDINMPYISGVDVLKDISHQPYVIFTTAYDSYAVRAFEEHAIDYLLKPYTNKRFYEALNRVEEKMESDESSAKLKTISELLKRKATTPETTIDRIAVYQNNQIILLDKQDILWVNASGNYVEFYTTSGKHLHYESMANLEQILTEPEFIRIHRSHIVRMNQIVSLRKHMNGEYFVRLKNNVELKMSRSNKDKIDLILQK